MCISNIVLQVPGKTSADLEIQVTWMSVSQRLWWIHAENPLYIHMLSRLLYALEIHANFSHGLLDFWWYLFFCMCTLTLPSLEALFFTSTLLSQKFRSKRRDMLSIQIRSSFIVALRWKEVKTTENVEEKATAWSAPRCCCAYRDFDRFTQSHAV